MNTIDKIEKILKDDGIALTPAICAAVKDAVHTEDARAQLRGTRRKLDAMAKAQHKKGRS